MKKSLRLTEIREILRSNESIIDFVGERYSRDSKVSHSMEDIVAKANIALMVSPPEWEKGRYSPKELNDFMERTMRNYLFDGSSVGFTYAHEPKQGELYLGYLSFEEKIGKCTIDTSREWKISNREAKKAIGNTFIGREVRTEDVYRKIHVVLFPDRKIARHYLANKLPVTIGPEEKRCVINLNDYDHTEG